MNYNKYIDTVTWILDTHKYLECLILELNTLLIFMTSLVFNVGDQVTAESQIVHTTPRLDLFLKSTNHDWKRALDRRFF